jgi:hypothetical protein
MITDDALEGWPREHLDDGERVIWQGRPLPGIRNRRWRALTTLFGLGLLVWGNFVLGGLVHHLSREGMSVNAPLYLLFGVAAIGGGVHYVFFQWRAAARAHLTTRYALTNRCACIMVGTGSGSVQRYRLRPETVIELDRHEGHSDLWFHVRYEDAAAAVVATRRVGFEGISDGGTAVMLARSIQTGTP